MCSIVYTFGLIYSITYLVISSYILCYIGFAQAWRRAGDALGDLRQYTAAIDYYDVAVRLDPTLGETLLSNIGKRKRL